MQLTVASNYDVLMIGAGISGLSARAELMRSGLTTCVLEKSRGTGGRMAVRRGEGWVADFGAQFTNVTTDAWRAVVEYDLENLVPIQCDQRGQSSIRYLNRLGINAFSKTLARDMSEINPILFSNKVVDIFQRPDAANKWSIVTESGHVYSARSILLTAPVPQSLELLRQCQIALSEESLGYLDQVKYDKCISVIAEVEGPLPELKSPIWKAPCSALEGIYDQSGKGVSGQKPVWVVHAGPALSDALWDQPEPDVVSAIVSEAQAALQSVGGHVTFSKFTLHKWRYSSPVAPLPCRFYQVGFGHENLASPPLLLAGDSFQRSSVEGAFCSGLAAAQHIAAVL